jgi:O-antigen ligase
MENELRTGPAGTASLVTEDDLLARGIWPKSLALWMVAFYIALFIIRPWEQLLPWLAALRFERVYAIAMIVVAVAKARDHLRLSFQTLAVVVFFLSLVVSAVFARQPGLAWDPMYDFATLLIFYFVILLVVRTPYELAFLTCSYIVTMAVYLAKSEWEFFVHGQHRFDQGVIRLCGIESTFGGPNLLAMSVDLSLPFLLCLWSVRNELSAPWPKRMCKWFRYGMIIYFLLGVSAVVLTNSRSGMLGFALFVVLAALSGKRIMRKVLGLGGVVLLCSVIWLVMPEQNKGRLRTIWDPESGPQNAQASAEGRIEGMKAGLEMFKRFPITGVGIGNFIEYRTNYGDGVPLQPHSLIGQSLGETGIVGAAGFVLMVLVMLSFTSMIIHRASAMPDAIGRFIMGLARASRIAVLLLLFEGIFDHNLLRFNWLWIAAFMVCASGALVRRHSKQGEGEFEGPSTIVEAQSVDDIEVQRL